MTGVIVAAALLGVGAVDARVQAVVDRMAAETAPPEAILVLDVATGGVLARAGHPDRPYPPGSTFKIVDVVAAAETRREALESTVRCDGRGRRSGDDVECWLPGGHGERDLEGALADSCNVYFGALGARVGTPALVRAARSLGVGIDPGRLPPASAPASRVADGVGVLATPAQVGALLRSVATGRRLDGSPVAVPEVLARLRRGLRAAVEHGTAKLAASSVPVSGKTGTAVLGSTRIGWFAGYAPAEQPSVVVVIVRRGATGHEVAGAAPAIFESFFHGAIGAGRRER